MSTAFVKQVIDSEVKSSGLKYQLGHLLAMCLVQVTLHPWAFLFFHFKNKNNNGT